mgnify:CR=1 FL=1
MSMVCIIMNHKYRFIGITKIFRYKLLKELINEVNRIGININQIVFNSNAQLYSKKDKEQLVAYMKKLNQSVSEAVVKIGNQ